MNLRECPEKELLKEIQRRSKCYSKTAMDPRVVALNKKVDEAEKRACALQDEYDALYDKVYKENLKEAGLE